MYIYIYIYIYIFIHCIYIYYTWYIIQVLQSDPFQLTKWPFWGLSDLELMLKGVTLKNQDYIYIYIYETYNLVKTIINHPPVITIFMCYVYHSQMGSLWHCFTNIAIVISLIIIINPPPTINHIYIYIHTINIHTYIYIYIMIKPSLSHHHK